MTQKEHEFSDAFGPCKGCGKYVEQLMEERFCTMTNKYPNAVIDRDIEFYRAMLEQHQTNLRRCRPEYEQYHRDLIHDAERIIDALIEYRSEFMPP